MNAIYELDGVAFKYGDDTVLDIHHVEFEQNKVIALQGANGAGKSTLLNLLALIEYPQKGKLVFRSTVVNNNNNDQMRRQIGFVQQNPYLFNMSVQQNVELGMKLAGVDKSQRALRAGKVMALLQIDGLAQKRAHWLSGGESQKVAIARTLVMEPDVLLMDEPFTFLDRETTCSLESVLNTIKRERSTTVIFTSHDHARSLSLADHVYNLVNGNVIPAYMVNLFHGKVEKEKHCFDTGKMKLDIPGDIIEGSHASIDSNQIVLSIHRLDSSMRNSFNGRISMISDMGNELAVTVDAGEKLEVMITKTAFNELGLQVGADIWCSFKSTAVNVY